MSDENEVLTVNEHLTVETVPIAGLVPAKRNANVMRPETLEFLRGSIQRVGFLQPVFLVRRGGETHIGDGHHRIQVLRELGHTAVLAVVGVDIPEARIEAIALGLNRLRGETDLLTAGQVIDDLRELGFTIEELSPLTGFSADELADFERMKAEVGQLPGLPAGDGAEGDDEGGGKPKVWKLEVPFDVEPDYRKVLSFLRKRAGRGGDLSTALVKLADELSEKKPTRTPKPAKAPKVVAPAQTAAPVKARKAKKGDSHGNGKAQDGAPAGK